MQRSLFWLLDHHPETGESLADVHQTALEHAVLADELGFHSLWIAEHHFRRLGTAANPAVVLAAIAQRTATIRLGPAVSVLPLRNAIQVAEDYALVDVLSGGRLNLGVGTGSRPDEFAGFGADFEGRAEKFDESLAALRKLWSSRALNVAPVQTPTPPIYVAATREESAHRVGLGGDSLLTLASPATRDVRELGARVEAHRRGLGDREADAIVMAFAHVAESSEAASAVVVPALARLMKVLTGAAPPDPGALYRQMVESGAGLFGTAEHVSKQLERYAEHGIDHVAFITRFGGMSAADAGRSLRRLAARLS